jgi:type I restriction enzyme S subunit
MNTLADEQRAQPMTAPDADKKLPKGWRRVRLREVCDRIDYGYTASADFGAAGPRFLRITDIQNGQVDWGKVPGCKISLEDEERDALADGDIVFARTGGTTGKSFLVRNPPRAVFASYLIRLRPSESTFAEYLSAFFQSHDYWRQIWAAARGGAQPNVNANLLGRLLLPLPPLAEQKQIAGILSEQMGQVARARQAMEDQLKAAAALPAAYLRDVFTSPQAQAWPRRRFAEIATTCSGTTPSRAVAAYYEGTIPWVKTGELKDGTIVETEEHITQAALQECSLTLLPVDTLLIAMYGQGQTRGRTGRLLLPATTNQACFAILPNPGLFRTEFLQYWFRYSYERLRRETEGRGGNQPNLNGMVLRDQEIRLPPLDEQSNVIDYLTTRLPIADASKLHLESQVAALDHLPAALLRRAFNGEI